MFSPDFFMESLTNVSRSIMFAFLMLIVPSFGHGLTNVRLSIRRFFGADPPFTPVLLDAWDACQGADVLLESPSAMAGVHIAEALGELSLWRSSNNVSCSRGQAFLILGRSPCRGQSKLYIFSKC